MKYKIILLVLLSCKICLSQQTVKMTNEYGAENTELQEILDFNSTFVEKLIFEGEELKGKFFEINLKEFRKGKLVKTENLFDGSEADFFKIDSTIAFFKTFVLIEDEKLTIAFRNQKFGSRKSKFKLDKIKDFNNYVLKDFFGRENKLDIPLNDEFSIFAIITPTIHANGSASYCEVVQSDVKPEELGNHFKIPHYFLITMRLK